MSAPHVPASHYYKESHGGVEKVNADPFAAGVRSTQQSRYREQMENLKSKRANVLFHKGKEQEWASERRALESGKAPGYHQHRMQLVLTEHPIRQQMGTNDRMEPSEALDRKYRTDGESMEECMESREMVGLGRKMGTYPAAQRQGLFGSLAPADARLLSSRYATVGGRYGGEYGDRATGAVAEFREKMAKNQRSEYDNGPDKRSRYQPVDAHPGKEVDYTSQLTAIRGPNFSEYQRNVDSGQPRGTKSESALQGAWTGPVRPQYAANQEMIRVTSINHTPTVKQADRILQTERPMTHMNVAKMEHLGFLS